MGFPRSVADEVFIRCARHCCLCGNYAGNKMELHHIHQVADGGEDTIDNCIPLCLNCHADVKAYNPRHPKGRQFTESELRGHRDRIYALYAPSVQGYNVADSSDDHAVFPPLQGKAIPVWGIPQVDRLCPFIPGEIVLIAGYPGMCKTTYVQHVVNRSVMQGCRVVYCSIKDSVLNASLGLITENALVNFGRMRKGELTEEDWIRIAGSAGMVKGENIMLIPFEKASTPKQLINIIENTGAEIAVVDDMNGIIFDSDAERSQFFYQIRSAAARSNTIVIFIYSMAIINRDRKPSLGDFPSDDYYRLFDLVQLIYRPKCIENDYGMNVLEVETVKNNYGNLFSYQINVHEESSIVCYSGENDQEL